MGLTVQPVKTGSISSVAPAKSNTSIGSVGPVSDNRSVSVDPTPGWNQINTAPGMVATWAPGGVMGASTTGGGGSTSSGSDPYSQYGGQAKYDQLVNDFNTGKAATMSSVADRQGSAAGQYHSSILDYLDQKKLGQGDIDNEVVNNELSKLQGANSITDMVSHGVRSSAVRLAQGNAGSSSAAEQLARAWGENGNRQMASVNNQYELGNNNIHNDQTKFDATNQTNLRHINESKSTIVNGIIDEATQKMSDLNYRASTASLPERIDIENEKNRIRNETMGKLQAYDGELTAGDAGVAPINPADAQAKAFGLNQAGRAAPNAFDINTVLPMNTLPAGNPVADNGMPLYIAPNTKKSKQ